MPPSPLELAGPVEQVFALCIVYLLFRVHRASRVAAKVPASSGAGGVPFAQRFQDRRRSTVSVAGKWRHTYKQRHGLRLDNLILDMVRPGSVQPVRCSFLRPDKGRP
jgi:hypothetical protein